MSVVIDASALVELLLRTPRAATVAEAVSDDVLLAPDLINVEVASALRRLVRLGEVSQLRAAQAIHRLGEAPLQRVPTLGLLPDIWRTRDTISAYDAAYAALARALDARLITADGRLARASGLGVQIVSV